MKLGYDNLKDAKDKLLGTFCLHAGRAFVVKNVWVPEGGPNDKFKINGTHLIGRSGVQEIDLEDPEFNCSDYKIGYTNQAGLCTWWSRIPVKQYKQGLNYDQVTSRGTNAACYQIEFKQGRPVGEMLEGLYPTYKKAAEILKAGEAQMMAFNRNFGMSRDKVHKDFILEYKGIHIGFTEDLVDFKLLEEHTHLLEALKEAAN